jgi:hypothetical protein
MKPLAACFGPPGMSRESIVSQSEAARWEIGTEPSEMRCIMHSAVYMCDPFRGGLHPFTANYKRGNNYNWFRFLRAGRDWVHSARRPLFGQLYQPRTVDAGQGGAVRGTRIDRGNRKPTTVALCTPRAPHDLTWVVTQSAAWGPGQRRNGKTRRWESGSGDDGLILKSGSDGPGRLCGLVVRVPGYRHRGPAFDFRRYKTVCVAVSLERGPLSRMRINVELHERKSLENWD